jgi:hypothetical protein
MWIVGVFVIVLILVFYPLLIIWSLNTLFGLGIAYTLKTWLASSILTSLFYVSKGKKE